MRLITELFCTKNILKSSPFHFEKSHPFHFGEKKVFKKKCSTGFGLLVIYGIKLYRRNDQGVYIQPYQSICIKIQALPTTGFGGGPDRRRNAEREFGIAQKMGAEGVGPLVHARYYIERNTREMAKLRPALVDVLDRRATARHPNFLRTDRLVDTDLFFIIMDRVEGRTLNSYGERGLDHSSKVALCGKINRMHNNDIVHNDLHYGNIFIRNDGEPYILDYGLARQVTPRNTFKDIGVNFGDRQGTYILLVNGLDRTKHVARLQWTRERFKNVKELVGVVKEVTREKRHFICVMMLPRHARVNI